MISRLINRSKDYLTLLPGMEQRQINALKGKVSCLLYHRIEPYGQNAFLDQGGSPVTSPADFDAELNYLTHLPSRFFTLQQLLEGEYPDKDTIGIVICFDDCLKSNYQDGMEVLNKYQIPAVFFQTTSLIDSDWLLWEHLLYWVSGHHEAQQQLNQTVRSQFDLTHINDSHLVSHLRENLDPLKLNEILIEVASQFQLNDEITTTAKQIYPSEKMLIESVGQGHEIASHGHYHFKRSQIDADLFETELTQSKIIISQITNQDPVSFSYPFNSFYPDDHLVTQKHYPNTATVSHNRIEQALNTKDNLIPRLSWPGISTNSFRMKRWLLTGRF